MYLRVVRAAGGKGKQYEYVRLCESYREKGKNKQRVVFNLGRKDILAAHLDDLVALLSGQPRRSKTVRVGEVEALGAWDWGPMLVARTLWQELGLEQTLDRLGGRKGRDGASLSDRALVLVANRLCEPSSEHGLARWLETDFVCDRYGRRWMPEWRQERERKASSGPRVRVEWRQLGKWYRTLDQLIKRREKIEKELYLNLRELFSLKVDLVLYDLTSTYFEGHGPPMSKHGHSRDGKSRNRQVLVGLVMVDGWPITHHVFEGNWRDSKTVPGVIADLERRFGLRRIVFVGDRGMVTSDNLKLVRSREGMGYVVGLNRRRREEVYRYIERAVGEWAECPMGITSREKTDPPRTLVQEVEGDEPGVRIFVVHSDERLAYERAQRLKAMERVREELEALEQRVAKGRLKAAAKIGAAAARILQRNHGYRYYDWKYKKGRFSFFEHPVNLKREQAYEGKYVIQTEEKDLSPVQAVGIYKDLSEVERAFCNLKDVIDMRPIYHRNDDRVQAHIFVAALAFLVHRAMEKKLKAAGVDLSATEALKTLRSVRMVEFRLPDGATKRSVTRGTSRAARVLGALGIADLGPPALPKEASTVA
jgi:transposase